MSEVVDIYTPVVEQLRARVDELPEWCREGVKWLILQHDVMIELASEKNEEIEELRKEIDELEPRSVWLPRDQGGT